MNSAIPGASFHLSHDFTYLTNTFFCLIIVMQEHKKCVKANMILKIVTLTHIFIKIHYTSLWNTKLTLHYTPNGGIIKK